MRMRRRTGTKYPVSNTRPAVVGAVESNFLATGVWTGDAVIEGDRLLMQLNILDRFGTIEGALLVGDPALGVLGPIGSVTGDRSDAAAVSYTHLTLPTNREV